MRSCISQKGFGRYFLSPHADLSPDIPLTYLPYWRFKGVMYTCTPEGVEDRFMDISWLALENPPPCLPYSLGFRSQALSLTRVSVRTRGTFIRPVDFKQSFPRKTRETGPVFFEDIGETVSLIFSPFFDKEGEIFDAVLGQALGGPGSLPESPGCRPEKETHILSGLCPDCGWDLEGQSDSLVLACRNCHTLWQPRDKTLGRIRFGCAVPETPDQVLIPFWQIRADLPGLSARSDLLRLANLPGPETDPAAGLSYWAPAFKIRPAVFLRLSRQLILAQPAPALNKTLGTIPLLPVTLPASEAIQSIRVTLASLARPLREQFGYVSGLRLKPESATLVYLPFAAQTHEYVNDEFGLAVNQNMLNLSGNL